MLAEIVDSPDWGRRGSRESGSGQKTSPDKTYRWQEIRTRTRTDHETHLLTASPPHAPSGRGLRVHSSEEVSLFPTWGRGGDVGRGFCWLLVVVLVLVCFLLEREWLTTRTTPELSSRAPGRIIDTRSLSISGVPDTRKMLEV